MQLLQIKKLEDVAGKIVKKFGREDNFPDHRASC
jgi:hypothetical protein